MWSSGQCLRHQLDKCIPKPMCPQSCWEGRFFNPSGSKQGSLGVFEESDPLSYQKQRCPYVCSMDMGGTWNHGIPTGIIQSNSCLAQITPCTIPPCAWEHCPKAPGALAGSVLSVHLPGTVWWLHSPCCSTLLWLCAAPLRALLLSWVLLSRWWNLLCPAPHIKPEQLPKICLQEYL